MNLPVLKEFIFHKIFPKSPRKYKKEIFFYKSGRHVLVKSK